MSGKASQLLLAAVLWAATACSRNQPREIVLGEAYVGPSTVRLRQELTSPAPDGAVLRHGEKVEIVGRRRIFVRVRTATGARGWLLMRQLLSPKQMQELERLAQRASRMPSHGKATVYAPLNVHTEPHRQAPAFHQIQEGEIVEVLLQRLEPRVPYRTPALLPPPPKPEPRPARKRNARPPDLVLPPPPKPPGDWLELSGWSSERIAQRATKSLPSDIWALVRLGNGRAGWVLARPLRMEIPDEVAQYSEGQRITSYFSAGTVTDRGEVKHNWLWTTIAPGNHPYDFDSFRYFVWNTRRHRYETAYVERKLKGYFPVRLHPVEVRLGTRRQMWPGFSLVVEEADGKRYRRTYAYQAYLVRLVSKEPWQPEGEEADWWMLAGR
ncbi:MAG: SH3 domain-containing protein [Bryobacterales bacterium]|nr:hypothetical protein [Bryobacteraceae bacterium]MDW8130457.1 SH3 domain-containing protein [Bryobacterales bacterium]